MKTNLLPMSAIIALSLAVPTFAAAHCSIHPMKGASADKLKELAKVSQADAEKTAIARLKQTAAVTVADAELESEHGCLVWSFDLSVAGKSGVQEVAVDAGTGKVLSVKHETHRQEAAERAAEHEAPR